MTNPTVTLTQQQAQFLLSRLSIVASAEQDYRQRRKAYEQIMWNNADKDKPDGEKAFALLNEIRDNIRESKRNEARVNEIIRKLRTVNV